MRSIVGAARGAVAAVASLTAAATGLGSIPAQAAAALPAAPAGTTPGTHASATQPASPAAGARPAAAQSPGITLKVAASPATLPTGGGTVTSTYVVTNTSGRRAYYRSLTDTRCPSPRLAPRGGLVGSGHDAYLEPGRSATFTCTMEASVDTVSVATATFAVDVPGGKKSPASATARTTVRVAGEPCVDLAYSSAAVGSPTGTIGRLSLSGTSIVRSELSIARLTGGRYTSSLAFALDPVARDVAYFAPYDLAADRAVGGLWRVDLQDGTARQVSPDSPATRTVRLGAGPDGRVWSWAQDGRLYAGTPTARGVVWDAGHVVGTATAIDGTSLTGDDLATFTGGDVEVTGSGNVVLLAGRRTGDSAVLGISAEHLDRPTLSPMLVGRINPPVGGGSYGGLAFGPGGRLYASVAARTPGATRSALYELDIETGRSIPVGSAAFSEVGAVSDLGSCALPRARVQVTRRAITGTASVNPGDRITYEVTVSSRGLLPLAGVQLRDAAPAGTTYVPGSTTLNGAGVPDVDGVMPFTRPREVHAHDTIRPGVIGRDRSATVRFSVRVNDALPSGTSSIDSRALVTTVSHPGGAASDDPESPGGQDPTTVPIARAVLRISAGARIAPVSGRRLQQLTYTVTNTGTEPVVNVTVTGVGHASTNPVTEDQCENPQLIGGDDNRDGRLDPHETWAYRCTSAIAWGGPASTPRTVDVTVQGVGAVSAEVATGRARSSVTVVPARAQLQVTQQAGASVGPDSDTGDIVTAFSTLIHNTGDRVGRHGTFTESLRLPAGMILTRATWIDAKSGRQGAWKASRTGTTSFPITPVDPTVSAGETQHYRVRVYTRWTGTGRDLSVLSCRSRGGIRANVTAPAESRAASRADNGACVDAPRFPRPRVGMVGRVTVPAAARPGSPATFTWTVTNASPNIFVQRVAVSDGIGRRPACTWAALAPGAIRQCTVRRPLTAAEVRARVLSRGATVTATPAGFSRPVGGRAQVSAPVGTGSALALTSTVRDPGAAGKDAVGDVVTYTFTLRNTGTTTLTRGTIADAVLGLRDRSCGTWPLAAGASTSCTFRYALREVDVTRGHVTTLTRGSAWGVSARGIGDGAAVIDDATSVLDAVAGKTGLRLEKSQIGGIVDADSSRDHSVGDLLFYTFRVRNLTHSPVRGLAVVDVRAGGDIVCDETTLAVGASTACRLSRPVAVTAADLQAGFVLNTATATALPSGTTSRIRSNVPAVTTRLRVSPRLGLVVSAGPVLDTNPSIPGPSKGDTVTYRYVVTNPTGVPVTGIRVGDPRIAVTCPSATIPARGRITCTGTYTLTRDDVDAREMRDSATATGTAAGHGTATSASVVTRTVVLAWPRLRVDVATSAAPGRATVGQDVTYTFTLLNAGAGTLAGARLTDPVLGLRGTACGAVRLAPGDRTTCTAVHRVTQDEADHGLVQTSTVAEADAAASTSAPVLVSAGADLVLPVATPATTLGVSPSVIEAVDLDHSGGASAGDALRLRYTVTNTGAASLRTPAIDDPGTGVRGYVCTENLAPGESVTCEVAPHVLTAADVAAGSVVAEPTVRAVAFDGRTVAGAARTSVSLTDRTWVAPTTDGPAVDTPGTQVDLAAAARLSTDRGTRGVGDLGDAVSYTFQVTNRATAPVDDLRILVPALAAGGIDIRCPPRVAPGATVTCSTDVPYSITAVDLGRMSMLAVSATASAQTTAGDLVTSTTAYASVRLRQP